MLKHRIISNLSAILLMILLITVQSSSAAVVPNGQGVQKYNPGVGWNDFAFIKGDFIHAVFDWGDIEVKSGTWLTVLFGVTTGLIDPDVPLEDSLAGIQGFMDSTSWYTTFDGIDITEGVVNSGFWDNYYQFFFEIDGVEYQEVVVRFAYYIIPQAIGCYTYHGEVGGDGFYFETNTQVCWLPGNVI